MLEVAGNRFIVDKFIKSAYIIMCPLIIDVEIIYRITYGGFRNTCELSISELVKSVSVYKLIDSLIV